MITELILLGRIVLKIRKLRCLKSRTCERIIAAAMSEPEAENEPGRSLGKNHIIGSPDRFCKT